MARNLICLGIMTFGLAGCTEDPDRDGNNDNPPNAAAPEQLECISGYYGGTPDLTNGVWSLRFNDGTRVLWDDGVDRTFDELLRHPEHIDLRDMVATPYPTGPVRPPTEEDGDAGYFAPPALLDTVYGHDAEEVEARLVAVRWFGVPEIRGDQVDLRLMVHDLAGPDTRLMVHDLAAPDTRALARDLRDQVEKYPWLLDYISGDDCCASYAPVDRPDMLGMPSEHAYGIAVDLNKEYGHAWFTQVIPETSGWRDEVPTRIVRAFESAGYAWGGRAWHYRTNHFVWRPELFDEACQL